MRIAVAEIASEIASGALAASDAAGAYGLLLGSLRKAWRADRAILMREDAGGAAATVAEAPAKGRLLDPQLFAPALGAEASVSLGPFPQHGAVLALGLRLPRDGAWCLGLVRPATRWTAPERGALAELRPSLALAVEHALQRARLAEARAREESAAAEHERFLSVISHELRNPLAPILMWTSTLRRLRGEDPDVQRAARAIANAVNLERRLIEALLDLSRLERGVLELVIEETDLREVLERAVQAHRERLAEARVALDLELPPAPVPVRGDTVRLLQMLETLLDNAIRYGAPEGTVSIGLTRRGGAAELTVRDTGPGLPAEILPRLFTPFVQGPNAHGGLGLGLALTQRLLALQHGTIEAANARGAGATFVITLPLDKA
jgi:signal transduction histidine kinase